MGSMESMDSMASIHGAMARESMDSIASMDSESMHYIIPLGKPFLGSHRNTWGSVGIPGNLEEVLEPRVWRRGLRPLN